MKILTEKQKERAMRNQAIKDRFNQLRIQFPLNSMTIIIDSFLTKEFDLSFMSIYKIIKND